MTSISRFLECIELFLHNTLKNEEIIRKIGGGTALRSLLFCQPVYQDFVFGKRAFCVLDLAI